MGMRRRSITARVARVQVGFDGSSTKLYPVYCLHGTYRFGFTARLCGMMILLSHECDKKGMSDEYVGKYAGCVDAYA